MACEVGGRRRGQRVGSAQGERGREGRTRQISAEEAHMAQEELLGGGAPGSADEGGRGEVAAADEGGEELG